jgi:hypothetical protein
MNKFEDWIEDCTVKWGCICPSHRHLLMQICHESLTSIMFYYILHISRFNFELSELIFVDSVN